jgi:hypothetical protein
VIRRRSGYHGTDGRARNDLLVVEGPKGHAEERCRTDVNDGRTATRGDLAGDADGGIDRDRESARRLPERVVAGARSVHSDHAAAE